MSNQKKILICGDSFAADWQCKYPQRRGWPNQLAEIYSVVNAAQAGCGEYRIWQQLEQHLHQQPWQAVIVSHTSPNRVFIRQHPVHHDDVLHGHSDAIYADIQAHVPNYPKLASLARYFEQWFDLDHARDMHGLICERIDRMTQGLPTLHVTHIDWQGLYEFPHHVNCSDIFSRHRGDANHYSRTGNEMVLQRILENLE